MTPGYAARRFATARTRTVRIHGVSTSIRMENFMWDTLAALAAEEGVTTNALIAQFHDEIMRHRGDVLNFSSFLRVTCLRYLRRKLDQAEGEKPDGSDLPASRRPALRNTH